MSVLTYVSTLKMILKQNPLFKYKNKCTITNDSDKNLLSKCPCTWSTWLFKQLIT